MAYYRRKTRSRRRRPAFSRRQTEAIIRLAQAPVETKRYAQILSPGRYVPGHATVGGASPPLSTGAFYNSPISVIPREGQGSTDSAQPTGVMEGDKIIVKGLKLEAQLYVIGTRNWTVRITLVSGNPFGGGATWSSTPQSTWAFTSTAFDMWTEKQTTFDQFTQKAFNSNKWNILKQKTIRLGYMDGSDVKRVKIYYRMNSRKEADDAANTGATQLRMGFYSGVQYYWVVEWFSPVTTALTTTDNIQIGMEQTVFFKDA